MIISLFIEVPTNYDFVYSVHDDYTGDEHSHSEQKVDYITHGKYTVKLPDGRTQVGLLNYVNQSEKKS